MVVALHFWHRHQAGRRRFYFITWLALLACPLLAQAQQLPLTAYTFAASTAPYVEVPFVFGVVNVRDIQQDANESRTYPIGFPFVFEGTTYTTFAVASDGWLSLGFNPYAASNNGFNVAGSTAARPLFAPLWDDLNGDALGAYASFVVEGTAPSRVLTMEWRNWRWPHLGAVTLSFEVKLYETTNVIQYCYRQEAGVPNPTDLSATIGVGAYNSFLSLSNASGTPAVSRTISTDNINQRPATGQVYTFTPPPPCPDATGLAVVVTSPTTASVSFVPGAGNTSYTLSYSATGPGNPILNQAATGSPALLTGLLPNTTYEVHISSTCASGALSPGAGASIYFFTPAPPNSSSNWTGTVSRAWNVPGNWSAGLVPTATTNVILDATANQPLVTGTQACGNLQLRPNATLTVGTAARLEASGNVSLPPNSTLAQEAGSTFGVGGNWTNNGTAFVLDPTSTVAFREGIHALGGAEPTVLQNVTIGELTITDELDLMAPLSVQRLLKTTQSSIVQVTAGGSLRLLSNAQGTAQVVRDADSFIAGTVTVERSLAGPVGTYTGLGRHYYAPPVRQATLAQLTTPGFGPVVNAAYNTSATPGSVVPYPSAFAYDQSRISTNVEALADFETGFYSPAALSEAFVLGQGYRLDAPGTATLAVAGPLTYTTITRGGLTAATLPQSAYHLLGNPYAAVLDWDAVAAATTTTGLDAAVYTYQPTGPDAGVYQPYVNGVGTARYLLPGQAFFVRVSAPSTPASVAFTQAMRYPGYFDEANPPAAPAETRPLMQLALAGTSGPGDAATVYFQAGATAGADARFDARKLPTSGVPYVAFADAQQLAISGRPVLGTADVTLPLTVRGPVAGAYTLAANRLLNLPTGTYAYLRDAQTGATIDLRQQASYAFSLASTAATGRFSLLLTRTQLLATAPAALVRQIDLYPVPARGAAWLALPNVLHGQSLPVVLRNTLGQAVRTATLPAGARQRALDLVGLPPGAYSVELLTSEGLIMKRLLVE